MSNNKNSKKEYGGPPPAQQAIPIATAVFIDDSYEFEEKYSGKSSGNKGGPSGFPAAPRPPVAAFHPRPTGQIPRPQGNPHQGQPRPPFSSEMHNPPRPHHPYVPQPPVQPQPQPQENQPALCRHFSQQGYCKRGSECGFLHVVPTNAKASSQSISAPHGAVPAAGGSVGGSEKKKQDKQPTSQPAPVVAPVDQGKKKDKHGKAEEKPSATSGSNKHQKDKKQEKIEESDEGSKGGDNSDKYCNTFAKNGSCPYGDQCQYSHILPPCKYFLEGTCNKEKCHFPHAKPAAAKSAAAGAGGSSKKAASAHVGSGSKDEDGSEKYCNTFAKNGSCPHGDKCLFSHILPPCKYFLEGNCTKDKCHFPHVKAAGSGGSSKKGKDSKDETPSAKSSPMKPAKGIEENGKMSAAAPKIDMRQAVEELQHTVRFLDEEERKALTLDLVIVMDCTASMERWIIAAKEKVQSFLRAIQEKFAHKATIRVGYVAYRDYDVPHKRVESIPLTENINAVKTFIQNQQAEGGDDTPEDIPGGIKAALDMNWQASAKVMMLVTDAPCHGSRYHDFPPDNDTRGRPTDPNIEDQMREIARRGIGFAMIDIRPRNTRMMIPLLRAAYESVANTQSGRSTASKKKTAGITNSVAFHVVPFDDKASSDAQRDASAMSLLIETMVDAASTQLEASATKSLEALMRRERKNESLASKMSSMSIREDEKEEEEEEEEVAPASTLPKAALNWDLMEHMHSENAMRYTYWFNIQGVDKALWSADPLKYLVRSQQRTTVRVMRSSFNEGQMRTAHGLQDEHISHRLVAKVYKKEADRKLQSYQLDAQVQTIAKGLAKEFSKHPKALAAIDFISVSYYEMLDRQNDNYFKYFAAEPFMTGSYIKYNNNAGWTMTAAPAGSDGKSLTPAQQEFGKIAQAFSHFTWEHTNSMLHCVDLQGVDNILTDPQIHSKEGGGKLGKGDVGRWGTALFFKSHVCNEHCKALELPVRNPAVNTAPVPVSALKAHSSDQVQVCCELYCGTVFSNDRTDYLKELDAGREIYCQACKDACKNETATQTCQTCKHSFTYKAYWYRMKGQESPKECTPCKNKAKK